MTLVFWVSVLAVVYAYFGYPFLLYLLSLFRNHEFKRVLDYFPRVSFIVTVYNEEKRIEQKIANTLALDYPAGNLEVIFASDASTDATDEIVNSRPELKLVRSPERRGKETAQKCAIDESTGEILVFSDVAAILKKDAIRNIVASFADESIGCVSSVDRFIEEGGGISGEGAYVRYEMFLRGLESRVNTLVGLSGSFFAARRVVCEDLAVDIQSDFNTVFNSIKRNLKGVLDPEAVGYYKNIADEKKEFARKVRTVLRGISVMKRNLPLLNPFKYGLFSWQLFSHKLCRWLVPFFLILMFASNVTLMSRSVFFASTFILQLAFYSAAALYSVSQSSDAPHKLSAMTRRVSKIPYYFVTVNTSILLAWWSYVKGQRATFWEPSKR